VSRMKDVIITIKIVTSIVGDKNEKVVAARLKHAVEQKMQKEGLPQHSVDVSVEEEVTRLLSDDELRRMTP